MTLVSHVDRTQSCPAELPPVEPEAPEAPELPVTAVFVLVAAPPAPEFPPFPAVAPDVVSPLADDDPAVELITLPTPPVWAGMVSALDTAWPSRKNPPAATTVSKPRCTYLCMTILSLSQKNF